MPLSVQCGECGAKYSVDEKLAGKRAKCKKCGASMTIPAPASAGAADDDLSALMELAQGRGEDAPVPPRHRVAPPPAPPAGWTPESVVIEAAPPPLTPGYGATKDRRVGRASKTTAVGIDGATPFLILLFVASNVYSAIRDQMAFSGVEGAPGAGVVWTGYITNVVLYFVIVGPLVLLGAWIVSKILGFPMVDGAYLKALGVAAVPGVMLAVVTLLPNNAPLRLGVVAAMVPLTFYVLKYVFDLDWVGSILSFVFGGGGYLVGQLIAKMIVGAVVVGGMSAEQRGVLAKRGSPGGGPGGGNVSRSTGVTQAPTPQLSETDRKRQDSAARLRQIFAAVHHDYARNDRTWPADLATLQQAQALDAQALSSPFGPAFPGPDYAYTPYVTQATPTGEVVLAHDAAELASGEGASVLFGNGTVRWLTRDEVQAALQQSESLRASAARQREQQLAAERRRQEEAEQMRQAAVNAAPQGGPGGRVRTAPSVRDPAGGDPVGRIKAAGKAVVAEAVAVPLPEGNVEALVRPATPGSAFALVSRAPDGGETVEVFGGDPPASRGSATFTSDTAFRGAYALSADGKLLARLVSFPRKQAVVYSFEKKADVAALELKAADGVQLTPLGFPTADRLVVRYTRGFESAVELFDLKTGKSLRRLPLPDVRDASAANEAVSPDGRYLAVTGRGKVRGKDTLQLTLLTLMGGGDPRRLAVTGLDEQFLLSAHPSGIAFSADGGKVAALFEVGGRGLVTCWNARTGKPAGEFVIPAMPNVPTDSRLNRGRGLDWVAGGRALLVCGTILLDADNGGAVIATLDAGKPRGQVVLGPSTFAVAYGQVVHIDDVVAVTLDEQKLPPTAQAAPGAAGR